jgi:hypothetical protein
LNEAFDVHGVFIVRCCGLARQSHLYRASAYGIVWLHGDMRFSVAILNSAF